MIKLITILVGCSFALAVGVKAKQEDTHKKPAQTSKSVQKQQFSPKQQHAAPNTHVQSVHTQHTSNLKNSKVHDSNVSKQKLRTLPAVQSNKVQTKKLQTDKLQTNKLPLNKETLRKIHAQHLTFHAKPNTAIASAQFNRDYRIPGSQNWSGPQYQAFISYQPQWHDQGWYQSHYSSSIVLIGGGWYYWDTGYWYPAWGYDTAAAYYPYDGPIYVGDNRTPFDQVVADVQSVLQEQGYYHGEVDGLVGPLTQQALSDYQRDRSLVTTAAIDQPTLASLGLG